MKTSIAMATFNGAEYLEEQLLSFAEQNRLPDELVVSDDHSTDETWDILSRFAASASFPVRIVKSKCNEGVTPNFQSALEMSAGDIIFLSDQDDVWPKNKLSDVASVFESNPDTAMVFANALIVDNALRPLGKTLWEAFEFTVAEQSEFDSDPFTFLLTNRNVVTGAAAAFARKVVDAALPIPVSPAIPHDAWLALIASHLTTVRRDPNKLLLYRQHPNQVTGVTRSHPNFGKQHYIVHLEHLTALHDRMRQYPSPDQIRNLELTRCYIEHLRARIELNPTLLGRIGPVFQELSSGRYSRFSSGLRSAAKDLLSG